VGQDAYYKGRKKAAPLIYIYRPAEGNKVLRTIKRPPQIYSVFHARGDFLWAGSPGIVGIAPKKTGSTKVHEYDMRSGKMRRAYTAPKRSSARFGAAFAADDRYLWIGDDPIPPLVGSITQYSRKTAKVIRRILPPAEGNYPFFGGDFVVSGNVFITSMRAWDDSALPFGLVQGSSVESGEVLWSFRCSGQGLGDPALALLPGNLLAVGDKTLGFYRLGADGEAPQFLAEVTQPSGTLTIARMQVNGSQLAIQRGGRSWGEDGTILDLRSIPALQPYLETPVATGVPGAGTNMLSPMSGPVREEMKLQVTEAGWKVTLPSLPYENNPPGKKTVLETSDDLTGWSGIAEFEGGGVWTRTGGSVTVLPDGRSFLVPKAADRCFFRISLIDDPALK
jgi:hypothetical protein